MPLQQNKNTVLQSLTSARFGACVAIFFILLYVMPLGGRPMFIPDEMRYGEIPREMIEGGDWSLLRLCGLRYYEKPPLGYWLNAVSMSLLGEQPFAVRLPTALSAGLTAVAVFLLVRSVRRDSFRAVLAAMVYLTFFETFALGTFATLDTMFVLFVTLSMAALYKARIMEGRSRVAWSVLAGVACAAAFLTKGFTAVVIPALVAAAWLPWERRAKELLTVWIIPVVTAFVAVLPVALILHAHDDDFWNYFFWVEHVQRFVNPGADQHTQPVWFFLPVLIVGALPWTLYLPAASSGIRNLAKFDSLTRFSICWAVLPFVFFSLCGGKLASYILPCFAPLAILLTDSLVEASCRRAFRRWSFLGAGLFLLCALLLVLTAVLRIPVEEVFDNATATEKLLLGATFVVSAVFLFKAGRCAAGDPGPKPLFWVAMASAAIFFSSFHFMPKNIEDNKSPSRLLEWAVPLTPENSVLVVDRTTLSSVSWHYRRTDALFFLDKGEFAYGIARPEGKGRFFENWDFYYTLKDGLDNGRPLVVCLRDDFFETFTTMLFPNMKPSVTKTISSCTWALYMPQEPDGEP